MAKDSVDNALVAVLLDAQAPGPAAAWLHRGEGTLNTIDAGTALAAVEAARRLGKSERLVVAQGAQDKAVRKAAGAALHKLKAAGAVVEAARAPKVAGLSVEAVEALPPRAMIGLPAPNGYFPFMLMSFSGHEAIVCMGMAGCAQGFAEEQHAHLPRAEAKAFLYQMRSQKGMVELPFVTGLSLVERALQASGRRLPGWGHLVENVDAFTMQMGRLKAMGARAQALPAEEAVARSLELSQGIGALRFLLEEGDVQEVMMGVIGLTEGGAERLDQVEALAAAAVDKAFAVPLVRETWTLALDVAGELYDTDGLADQARLARGLAAAVAGGQPASTIPFFTDGLVRIAEAMLP